MTDDPRQVQFLTYVQEKHLPSDKAEIAKGHFDAIKREMERTGSFRPNLRLLDVGCGQGMFTMTFASLGITTVGVDLDDSVLDIARKHASNTNLDVEFVCSSCERLPFGCGEFDIVFANSLLEHVEDWQSAVEEWIRVLAQDGLLWIETTNVLHPRQREFRWLPMYSWWPAPAKRLAVRVARGPIPALANYTAWPAVHWFSYFQLGRFLRERGMEVRDRFDVMDVEKIGFAKRLVRETAVNSRIGRWLAYLLTEGLIILARKPRKGDGNVSSVKNDGL